MRIFAPGFGAGAVGGYAVLRIDPAVVVRPDGTGAREDGGDGANGTARPRAGSSSEDVWAAFGD